MSKNNDDQPISRDNPQSARGWAMVPIIVRPDPLGHAFDGKVTGRDDQGGK